MDWELTSVSHGSHDGSHDSLARWLAVCQDPIESRIDKYSRVCFYLVYRRVVDRKISQIALRQLAIQKLVRQFFRSDFDPFLKIGVTLAILHSSGKVSVSIQLLIKISVKLR